MRDTATGSRGILTRFPVASWGIIAQSDGDVKGGNRQKGTNFKGRSVRAFWGCEDFCEGLFAVGENFEVNFALPLDKNIQTSYNVRVSNLCKVR